MKISPRGRFRAWSRLLLLCFCICGTRANAQWRCIFAHRLGDIEGVYFLDNVGHPEVGFIGTNEESWPGFSTGIFKTTDYGASWQRLGPADQVLTFCFMDADTGWAGALGGIYKSTDQGNTWVYKTKGTGHNLSFDNIGGGLFFGGDDPGFFAHLSWNRGETWTADGPFLGDCNSAGASFWDGGLGVMIMDGRCVPWAKTTDGGHTWSDLLIDSTTSQPLCVFGTRTAFCLTMHGSVLRTDDAWDTWRILKRFTVAPTHLTTGVVMGKIDSLFVLLDEGAYMSLDTGISWTYLCGVPSGLLFNPFSETWARHFYKVGNRLYIPTLDTDTISRLWLLDLDSLHASGFVRIEATDNSKTISISPGKRVSLYCSNSTVDTSAIADSAHFVIRYDENSLSLESWTGMNGWYVINTIQQPGSIEVWLHGTRTLNTLPILSTRFSTVLADTVTNVYLDQPVIYSHRRNCDCAVTSNLGGDSVKIDFLGCGGPTLWHFMQTGTIFELLSVSPNPAASELEVTIDKRDETPVSVEVTDLLGKEQLRTSITGLNRTLDISRLPSGAYFLRLSSSGEVRTRRFVIEH